MKDTAIIYKWIEKGKENQKEICRKDFLAIFNGLLIGFERAGDNQVSKQLVKFIPEMDEIFINKDMNETQDIPSIAYFINGERKLLKIMRRNEVVWSILNKCCTK